MERKILITCMVACLCVFSSSEAFIKFKRTNGEEINKDTSENIAEPSNEAAKPMEDHHQVRKRRQWNDMDSIIKDIFFVPPTQPDNGRIERNIYSSQQYYPSNNYIQPPPPRYNNFVAAPPIINNHYLPPPFDWFNRLYCYYPVVITIPSYPPPNPVNPNPVNPNPINPNPVNPTNPMDGVPGVDIGNRFGETVNASAYNRTITGISLDPIPPLRPPSNTPPPLFRPDDDEEPRNQPRPPPQRPTARPPQRPAQQYPNRPPPQNQRPGNNNYYPQQPGNSISGDRVYFPEDPPPQNYPAQSQGEDNPNACVEAIVFCCLPNRRRTVAKDQCFEINGCPSSFFGVDPCETRLANEALRAVNMYRRRG